MEIGFKGNLTQLTSRYDEILVHLYVLLNRAGITEPNHSPPPVVKLMYNNYKINI